MTPAQKRSFRNRISSFLAILLVLAFVMGFRLADFQIVRASEIQDISFARRAVTQDIPALRGPIVDAAGNILARTVRRYDVNVSPRLVGPIVRETDTGSDELSVSELGSELAGVLDLDRDFVLDQLSGSGDYASLKRGVDVATYNAVRELRIPWVYYDGFFDRLYPNGAVAGNLLGFTDAAGVPIEGLETQFNQCLSGLDGQETFERSVEGVRIPTSAVVTHPTVDGGTLKLTIDSDLQFFAQQVLSDSVAELDADWAMAMVLEVETGRILVAAEAPSVDPNNPTGVNKYSRGSRIFRAAIEPGSVMKSISAAIILDTGAADPFDRKDVADRLTTSFGEVIKDSYNHETQPMTLTGVLKNSSNVGISHFGIGIPKQTRYQYLRAFGFGEPTSVDFLGESKGLLAPAKNWDGMTNYATLYGQGVAVTMAQMASAYQALANDGLRLPLRLVDSCTLASGEVVTPAQTDSVQVVSQESANTTMDMMEKVVEVGGVGRLAQVEGYRVAGKTGTAQVKEGSGYGSRFAISFYGVAPAEAPKFVIGVTIYRPVGVVNSAPATKPFKLIMEQALRHYRVPPSTTPSRNLPLG
jgi:cell division protein FtsI (penicillin-binding protein 3)